mmetsp:Transcript_17242/g.34963  ORF Transcript_17242/g.34963 Transcript_17242/m.34963 type:complete len:414 (+) Transcript_17242:77-1318(+)
MLDPVLIAVIVVVLTAIGAAAVFFIGSGSSSKSASKKAESPLDRHGKSIIPKEQSEHIEERPKSSVYSVMEESNEFSASLNENLVESNVDVRLMLDEPEDTPIVPPAEDKNDIDNSDINNSEESAEEVSPSEGFCLEKPNDETQLKDAGVCLGETEVAEEELQPEEPLHVDTNLLQNSDTTAATAPMSSINSNNTPKVTSRPNSLQRHDSNRTVSPMRSPHGRSLSTASSHNQYKRGGDTWILNANTEASAAAASPVSVTPVRHSLPKKIIPVSDEQQPLALRQGNKISEYEKGVLAEREKVSNRLLETRRKNITDVVSRVLRDGDVDGAVDDEFVELSPEELILRQAEIRKKNVVKNIASKFATPSGIDNPVPLLGSPNGSAKSMKTVSLSTDEGAMTDVADNYIAAADAST